MQINMNIKDLSLAQWQYLKENLPVDGQDFLPGLPRVCVVLELAPEVEELHVEMDAVALAGLLTILHSMDVRERAEAALAETPGLIDHVRQDAASVIRQLPNRADRDICAHHNPPHLYDCRA